MRISSNLPQFENRPTLIIVCGAQTARIFYAQNGEIEEVAAHREPTPSYSDREGFFLQSGKGKVFSSGSVYEPKDNFIHEQFLKELQKTLQTLGEKYDFEDAILTSPSYMENQIRHTLPGKLKPKTKYFVEGNYIKHHEHDLLAIISEKLHR